MILCVHLPGDAPGTEAWRELLDALDACSPLVEDARPGLAYLDMSGVPGDYAQWLQRIHAIFEPLALRAGLGHNRFCARAAAWIADGTRIDAGDAAARLQPLPLEVLELDAGVVERLHLLGITTLGALAKLPHGPFVRRFGPQAAAWHDAARGVDATPLVPRAHAMAIEASMLGEGSAESEAAVFFALRVLIARICSDLERSGKRAGALEVEIELESADRTRIEVQLAAATSQERAMLDVLRAKFEGMRFETPICGLRLRALGLEEGGEAQPLIRGDDIDRANVAVVLARLEAVLGEPVRRARTRAAHPLEERFVYEPFTLPPRDAHAPRRNDVHLVPQMRLLAVREIDVRLRRGQPASVDERRVERCFGPWRIDEGWFSGGGVIRDEYDVILDDGEICRIYHQGDCWYVRGTYD